MKWLPFFILTFLYSCKSERKGKPIDQNGAARIEHTTISHMPFETEKDSGYFKGYPSEKIEVIEDNGTTMLSQFLSRLITKKDIVLIDSNTLSHSVFIEQKTKMRYDTLSDNDNLIISEYNFSNKPSQVIKLNGRIIRNYKWDGSESAEEDILDLEGESFRHFRFKGKEFYYIRTRIMDGHYGSIHTISYHLIYNPIANSLNKFRTCRFAKKLFGDADGDDQLDYLDFDNSDFCTGVPSSDNVTIKLYSCNEQERFVLQKDNKGVAYFIDGKTGASLAQDSLNVVKFYWFKPIK